MHRTVLVAIGGNSLIRANEPMTVGTQRIHSAETCRALGQIVADGWRVVVTHGNGPQVGAALRRSELAAADTYPLPLDICVASTQGEIGVLLARALHEELESRNVKRSIAGVLAHVVVSRHDPAFAAPSKPIGRFYSAAEAEIRLRSGWMLVEEPPHGYRRAVASPEPLDILEEPAIRALVQAGVVVITLGGGGVPVVRDHGRIEGVEAVVDKDLVSSLLAIRLNVDVLVLSTDVDRVYVDFARPGARGLDEVAAGELRRLAAAGQFPAGTMGPKVDAALRFIDAGGREAIVTSSEGIADALQGHGGTHIMNEERPWTAFAR